MSTPRTASRRGWVSSSSRMVARSASRNGPARSSIAEGSIVARLKQHYSEVVAPSLKEKFGYANPMQVPRLDKIVINMGVGEAVADRKKLDNAMAALTKISGQKPVAIKARKSVANFKLREGMPIGCKVTLRRERMFEFLDRLVNVALPRVRDFRGV